MKLVTLLALVSFTVAAPWGDNSFEERYIDKHGRIVEVEYEGIPWISKVPAASAGAGVAAVRAAASVGGLTHQVPARFFLDIDDDDYIVRSGGKFGLGAPLLKATHPDGTNIYLDGSGEIVYTLDEKNNVVPLSANHPMLKSAAPGEHPFLMKASIELPGGVSREVVLSPNTKLHGAASPAGAYKGPVIAAKK